VNFILPTRYGVRPSREDLIVEDLIILDLIGKDLIVLHKRQGTNADIHKHFAAVSHFVLGWGSISLAPPQKIQKPYTPEELLQMFSGKTVHVLAIDFAYRCVACALTIVVSCV
jgi:hypothetical protein